MYKGDFKDDQKIKGVLVNFQNQKIVYEGAWVNDLFNGKGKLDKLNGQVY